MKAALKNFNKNIIISDYFILAILILISIIFVFYPPIIFPDSTEYYNYLNIFNGVTAIKHWDVLRGWGLPLVIWIITKIFGNTAKGIAIGMLLLYQILIITSYIIVRNNIIKKVSKKSHKIITVILYCLFIVLNPILFGYMHGLLTEFVIIPLTCLTPYVAYKWSLKDFNKYPKKLNILYTLFFIISFIFTWFIKQPYFSVAFFPLLTLTIYSSLKNKNLKNILYRISIFAVCCCSLLLSILMWKSILVKNGADYNGRNTAYFANQMFLGGLSRYEFNIVDSDLISNAQLKKNSKYLQINVLDDNLSSIDILYYQLKDEKIDIVDSVKVVCYLLYKRPERTINSYIYSYLSSIDVFLSVRNDKNEYKSVSQYNYYFNHENETIGLAPFNLSENTKWLSDSNRKVVSSIIANYKGLSFVNKIANRVSNLYYITFKLLFLIIPFIFFKLIYLLIKKKIFNNNFLELSLYFISFSLLNAIFHAATGAIIDRYIFIGFVSAVLGVLFYFEGNTDIKTNKKKVGKHERKK